MLRHRTARRLLGGVVVTLGMLSMALPAHAGTVTASDPSGDALDPMLSQNDQTSFHTTAPSADITSYSLVSNATGYDFHPDFAKQIEYIRNTPTIRDVLLSGGDPLLFSDEKLEALLTALRSIPHVEFLRIGTRIPIFLPQRITPELCNMLKKFHPLFLSVHSNHPKELTPQSLATNQCRAND